MRLVSPESFDNNRTYTGGNLLCQHGANTCFDKHAYRSLRWANTRRLPQYVGSSSTRNTSTRGLEDAVDGCREDRRSVHGIWCRIGFRRAISADAEFEVAMLLLEQDVKPATKSLMSGMCQHTLAAVRSAACWLPVVARACPKKPSTMGMPLARAGCRSVGGRLDAGAWNPSRQNILKQIAVIGGDFNHMRIRTQAHKAVMSTT